MAAETPPDDLRYCNCADPENCHEPVPGYVCKRGLASVMAAETPLEQARGSHGSIVAYAVTPEGETGEWHELTFEDGWQIHIFTDRPLVIVAPQQH